MNFTAEFMTGVSGVYAIIHRETGMVYVGSSVNMYARRYAHLGCAKRGSSQRIHRALREFGPAAFDFEVLERCGREALLEREQFYIHLFDSASESNLNTKADAHAIYGTKVSASTRELQRLAKLGKPLTAEHRAALCAATRRCKKTLSPEHRAAISAAHKTSPKCIAWMDKLHSSRKGIKEDPAATARRIAPLVGRKRPQWVLDKIAQAVARKRAFRKLTHNQQLELL